MLHRAGLLVGREAIERLAVSMKFLGPLMGERFEGKAGLDCSFNGFVIHIGKVAHMLHRLTVNFEAATQGVLQ